MIALIACWNQLVIAKTTELHSFHCIEEPQTARVDNALT